MTGAAIAVLLLVAASAPASAGFRYVAPSSNTAPVDIGAEENAGEPGAAARGDIDRSGAVPV